MTTRSRFVAETHDWGFRLIYSVIKSPDDPAGDPDLKVTIHDHRSKAAKGEIGSDPTSWERRPVPVSWNFLPAMELGVFGDDAAQDELREQVEREKGINTSELSDASLQMRDFDVIMIFAAPGISVSVNPPAALRALRGGEAEFDVAHPPMSLPLVEVIRLQDEERIPPVGMEAGQSLLLAPYFISSPFSAEAPHADWAARVASLILDYGNTPSDRDVLVSGSLERRFPQESIYYDVNEYLDVVFGHLNHYFGAHAPNDVAVVPVADGVLLRHLLSLIDVRVTVPLVEADPRFVLRKNTGVSNKDAKFAYRVNTETFETLFWENLTEQIDAGELITGGAIEDLAATGGPGIDAWSLRLDSEQKQPLIEIVTTGSVEVRVGAPLVTQMMQVITEEHLKKVFPPRWLKAISDFIFSLDIVRVYDVSPIDNVPEQGEVFDIQQLGGKQRSMGDDDSFQFLDEEMQVDLLDAGVRTALGPLGDVIDATELIYALYSDRDFYGRKVSTTQKLLMGLAVLPLVNRGLISVAGKGSRTARVLGAVDLAAMGAGLGIMGAQLYSVYDAVQENEASAMLASEFVFAPAKGAP